MITVKIGDGLGNQLFDYAFGYSLAKRNGEKLILDISETVNSESRKYCLDKFNLEYSETIYYSNRTLLHKIYKRLKRELCYHLVKEDLNMYRRYDERKVLERSLRNIYVYGYWINPKYFLEYVDDICEQFTPVPEIERDIAGCKRLLLSEETCAIHMRGGDIQMLNGDYFRHAIQVMDEKKKIDKYYIFTNQIDKARKLVGEMNLSMDIIFFDDIGDYDDIETFFLMSTCKNQIISNSTYSWWAAFLNTNENKVVIAPYIKKNRELYLHNWLVI